MGENESPKPYNLEDRTLKFSKDVIYFTLPLPRNIANIEIIKQLVRATGSVGANYIEANEALSKKDFVFRVKISRKEVKEVRYWLELIQCAGDQQIAQRNLLMQEATELLKIFSAIIEKSR